MTAVTAVPGVDDVYYVDTGMYDVETYGAVYIVDAERPAVIDTGIGTNYDRLVDALDAVGIGLDGLDAIVPTHVHLDHAGGTGFLARDTDATVYVHEIGAPHLVDPSRLVEGTKRAVGDQWRFYVEPEPVPEDRIDALGDGDVIDLGDRFLDVHHAPGHAPHQVVLHDPEQAAVYTADAAGLYVPSLDAVRPTTPPPNFDLEQCLLDIDRIDALDPDTLLYPHFGPADSGDRLEEYRDVLTTWVSDVEAKYADRGDKTDVIEHFVETADVVDAWGERKTRDEYRLNTSGVLVAIDRGQM